MLKNLKISFFLAYKSIVRGNKGTLSLTVLIMTLAFVNLIFISSIFMGIVVSMNEGAIENEFSNIVIEPGVDENYIKQVANMQSLIDSTPGVMGSAAHYVAGAIENFDENKDGKDIKSTSRPIKSINPENEKRVTKIHENMVAGEYLQKSDRDKIILGREISGGYEASLEEGMSIGVDVGDEIEVIFGNGVKRDYEVKGIFSTKNIGADQMIFITEKEMESVLGTHNMASEILVKIEQTGQEDKYIKEFRRIGITEEDIKPWTEYMGMVASVMGSFNMISGILGIIGAIVAGITIFIVIYVSVVNRRRQIGILKAIGMKEKIIINSYILQALFYAILGISLGMIIVFVLLVPYFLNNPLNFPMGWVSLAVTQNNLIISSVSLFVAALIGGFIPSWQGAKQSILDAIWGN